jgi:hypothetical protein
MGGRIDSREEKMMSVSIFGLALGLGGCGLVVAVVVLVVWAIADNARKKAPRE